jgi:purine-binding chemotaxis protein CheW
MNPEVKPAPESMNQLLPFTLDERKWAVDLRVVDRIVPLVEVTPLPKSPEIVLGVIDVRGEIIPVVNLRRRFGLAEVESKLSARLIIARTAKRAVALPVDSVDGVVERPAREVMNPGKVVPGTQYLTGFTRLDGDILLIHDLDAFLSLEEENRLTDALGVSETARK